MNVLGLITARGGSKGVPGKNIAPVAGRPLLAYTCDAARGSRRLARAVLSTDDAAIAAVGRECGVEVPFMRPAELARDDTPSLPVAQHAVRWLEEHEGWRADVLVLLQPTSPLRQTRHIDEAVERLEQTGADTVVSVVPVPHNFHPYAVMQCQDGWLADFWTPPPGFDRFRRQNLPPLYARNGPAVLVTRVATLMAGNSFYGARVAPYEMDRRSSLDIDDRDDLALAEALLAQRGREDGLCAASRE
jgi:CMP-N,N'-diacetyllegionaminic acid synthase